MTLYDDEEDVSLMRRKHFISTIRFLRKMVLIASVLTFIAIILYFVFEYYPKLDRLKTMSDKMVESSLKLKHYNSIIKNGEDQNRIWKRDSIIKSFDDILNSNKGFSFVNDIILKTQINKHGILVNNIIINYKPQIVNSKSRMLALIDTIYNINGVTKIIDIDSKTINVVFEVRK